jgi:hypothetical protein
MTFLFAPDDISTSREQRLTSWTVSENLNFMLPPRTPVRFAGLAPLFPEEQAPEVEQGGRSDASHRRYCRGVRVQRTNPRGDACTSSWRTPLRGESDNADPFEHLDGLLRDSKEAWTTRNALGCLRSISPLDVLLQELSARPLGDPSAQVHVPRPGEGEFSASIMIGPTRH